MTEFEGMNEIRIWAGPKYGYVNEPCACCDFRMKSYKERVK